MLRKENCFRLWQERPSSRTASMPFSVGMLMSKTAYPDGAFPSGVPLLAHRMLPQQPEISHAPAMISDPDVPARVIGEHDSNWHVYPPMEFVWKAQFPVQGGSRFAAFRQLQSPARALQLVPTLRWYARAWLESKPPPSSRIEPHSTKFLSMHESRYCSPSHA